MLKVQLRDFVKLQTKAKENNCISVVFIRRPRQMDHPEQLPYEWCSLGTVRFFYLFTRCIGLVWFGLLRARVCSLFNKDLLWTSTFDSHTPWCFMNQEEITCFCESQLTIIMNYPYSLSLYYYAVGKIGNRSFVKNRKYIFHFSA